MSFFNRFYTPFFSSGTGHARSVDPGAPSDPGDSTIPAVTDPGSRQPAKKSFPTLAVTAATAVVVIAAAVGVILTKKKKK